MNQFETYLTPQNKDKFGKIRLQRLLKVLRQEIFDHILKGNEDLSFDLQKFADTHLSDLKDALDQTKRMWIIIEKELVSLNWKIKVVYGGTDAYIYSSEEPPIWAKDL